MESYTFFLASSLEKVFPDRLPQKLEAAELYAFKDSKASVQLVYKADGLSTPEQDLIPFDISIDGAPGEVQLRSVELQPSNLPCYTDADDDYLRTSPGLFPDLLCPLPDASITPFPGQYRSVWITFSLDDVAGGRYDISIVAKMRAKVERLNGAINVQENANRHVYKNSIQLFVTSNPLPKQSLLHTEWFHLDSLSSYYSVDPFSTAHWAIIEKYMQGAAEHGINMLLTPIFTPPIDTGVGHERLTMQLVDVKFFNGQYSFDFGLLNRWIELCKKYGIEYLEIAHLFTQWGAKSTPKIIATVDGEKRQIFGWDIPATSKDYCVFLHALIPELKKFLSENGFDRKHVYFHISDEPTIKNLANYVSAKSQLSDLLDDCEVMDALSDIRFYQEGIVTQPIVANNHIQPFLDKNIPNLWVYYCCVQSRTVPNRFYALPSFRNRIMGVLIYLYRIKGFLHWGFNFYNSQYSTRAINPYVETDCGKAFPSGDPYLVYPGPDGTPLSSIRAEVQDDMFLDLRALQALESRIGRDEVEKIIYEGCDIVPFTFENYPRCPEYLEGLRKKVVLMLMGI